MRARGQLSCQLAYNAEHFYDKNNHNVFFLYPTLRVNLLAPHPTLFLTSPLLLIIQLPSQSESPTPTDQLYHSVIIVTSPKSYSDTSHLQFNPITESTHSNFTAHCPYIWLAIEIIIPTLGVTVSALLSKILDHNVFESTALFQHIAHTTTKCATIHLLSIPLLLQYLYSTTNISRISIHQSFNDNFFCQSVVNQVPVILRSSIHHSFDDVFSFY